MSFAAQSDIEDTIAALVQTLWKEGLGVDVKLPFPRMAYVTLMTRPSGLFIGQPGDLWCAPTPVCHQCFKQVVSLMLTCAHFFQRRTALHSF